MTDHKTDQAEVQTPLRLLVLPMWLIAIYAVGCLMSTASTIFLWVITAFFLFVLLDPLAVKLKKRGWPNAWTAVFLVFVATSITFGLIYLLGTLFSSMFGELEQSKRMILESFNSVNSTWHSWSDKVSKLAATGGGENIQKVEVVQSSPLGGDMGGTIMHGLGSAATAMTFFLLVPILAFFFLAERDASAKVMVRAFDDPKKGGVIWADIVKSTRAFFLGNLVLAILTYPVFTLLFWIFSVPAIFTAAAMATTLNLIPFIGAVLSGFLPSLTLYAQSQSYGGALGLYGCCVAIHFLVADLITPKILGSQVNINAVTSTIALVAWGEIWGGVGLILAIPLTSLIKILFEHSNYFWLQWLAGMMSEKVELSLVPRAHAKKSRKAAHHSSPSMDS